MTWEKGRDTIEDLLGRGHLERVPANTAEAEHLLAKADLPAATAIVDAVNRILPQLTVFAPRR